MHNFKGAVGRSEGLIPGLRVSMYQVTFRHKKLLESLMELGKKPTSLEGIATGEALPQKECGVGEERLIQTTLTSAWNRKIKTMTPPWRHTHPSIFPKVPRSWNKREGLRRQENIAWVVHTT